jgi:trigger factor
LWIDRRQGQLKISSEATGEREVSLTIEVEEERVNRARQRAAHQVSREINIPGFRKGRAPYDVIVQRLGEGVVREELVGILAEDVYREAMERAEIVAYGPGTLVETQFDPLVLTFSVPLAPEVDLGDYTAFRRPFDDAEVTNEAVARALEAIREQNAILAPVDRPAALGDVVGARLTGRAADGSLIVDEEEASVFLDPDAEEPIPGFIDALVGIEKDEERTFTLPLPDDPRLEEAQTGDAAFTARADSVHERIVPELDDDLARTVGNYDTLEELTHDIRQRIWEREQAKAESEYADRVLQDVIDGAEVSWPSAMLEEGIDDAVKAYERQIERNEHMMLTDYLRIQGKTMDQLREELRPDVEQSTERSLVLWEVVEQEGLAVSDEELDKQIAESSEAYGERADEVRAGLGTPAARTELRTRMLANRAVERLVAIARGEAEGSAEAVAEPLAPEDLDDSDG